MPGQRAVDMIMEHFNEEEIARRIASGEDVMVVLSSVWGEGGLRNRIRESDLDLELKMLCAAALDISEGRSMVKSVGYRSGPKDPPKKTLWQRLFSRS